MRIVFFGTPDFAVPSLESVAREHDVALVVAQPDRPAGRGMRLHKPPVAERAMELGLAVEQPPKVRDAGFLQKVRDLAPDAGVVVAYGRILPKTLLDIPKHGFLNVHGSLLPKYRGAAPIQRAIEAGERTIGATIMRVDEELDHGPMLDTVTIESSTDERLPSIARKLSIAGAEALARTLRAIENGSARETEQDHANATHAAKIEKEEGRVTFGERAETIFNRFRAFDPWPGVFFESGGETIKIIDMQRVDGSPSKARTIVSIGDGVTVAAEGGLLKLITLQRPGKPKAAAADVARGLGWRAGEPLP